MTDQFTLHLHAYADGELDEAGMAEVKAHLQTCARCRAGLMEIRELKAALRTLDFSEVAPEGLAAGIERRIEAARVRSRMIWVAAGGGLLAASIAVALVMLWPAFPVDDLIMSHRRALSGESPVAVASSDRGQIKPWLSQHLGFAPPVLEKAADCTLTGARTDHIAHQPASAVSYSCDGRRVDFYAVANRSPDAPLVLPRVVSAHDFHVVTWQRGRLTCYAVSDAPQSRLLALARYIQSHAAEG